LQRTILMLPFMASFSKAKMGAGRRFGGDGNSAVVGGRKTILYAKLGMQITLPCFMV
jgi:hypothetical protein